ncbi:MAG: TIGR00730 family Rossman fold protein [Clostridiales bacterium]|nr:TIGR00730 family Rossman fold protein [Clostridiales bacterium]
MKIMKICVFGAASDEIDNSYIKAVEEMGKTLAEKGHSLVFGAGGSGLMGAAARGFKSGGATITGVIPEFFKQGDIEAIYKECDELFFTETMRERKAKMEELADAFIVVPGGIGTFEELFEVMTLKQLCRHNKTIAIYNINGYYDAMKNMIEYSVKEGFVDENCKYLYGYCDSLDSLIDYVEANVKYDFSVEQLKNT